MNIYEEALAKLNKELRGGLYEYYEDEDLNIPIKALERAKKVEELLGLYRRIETDIPTKMLKRIRELEKELEEMK